MTDIIVTTPKSEIKNAAKEAAYCLANPGCQYFRRFPLERPPTRLKPGDRVWYVEDFYIRGFAVVREITRILEDNVIRDEWDNYYGRGVYVFMDADSWRWVDPVPMRGFQGFRYFDGAGHQVIGDWLMPKPDPVARGAYLPFLSPAVTSHD